MDTRDRLFGNANRTQVLVAIRLLEETWASELAQLLGLRLFTVQTIIASLEREGVLVGRGVGRSRLISLDRRYKAAKELRALTWALGRGDLELQRKLAARRRRPRRSGKEL